MIGLGTDDAATMFGVSVGVERNTKGTTGVTVFCLVYLSPQWWIKPISK